jgi:pimeloyl-ACP methyl ester carboxylesterase
MRRAARSVLWLIVLGAAVLAVTAYSHYRQDVHAARERIAAASQIASTPCGPIEYAVRGTGPPLLVVHGAGGGFDQGLLIAERLIEAGYQAIAVSRFGYLRTPMPPDATAAAQADSHACLLDALKLKRVAVLGASAGAPSSLQLAIRYPDRVSALMVLVPATYMPSAGGAGTNVPPGLERIINTALKWDFPFWLASRVARKTLIRTMLGTPPELLEPANAQERSQVARMLEFVLPVSLRRQGLLNDGEVTTTLQRYALERIRAPTLIISTQDDLYGTFERARYSTAEIPGARFVGYPTGGHLMVGRDAENTSAMLSLLRQSQTPF